MPVSEDARPTFTCVVDPEDLPPEMREVRDYWDAKRGARPMPQRRDIDPLDLADHLPYLSLVDVVDSGTDFRFRLLGTGITARFGRDSTGKRMSVVYGSADAEVRAWITSSFTTIVTSRRPVLMRGVLRVVDKDFIHLESFHLPLSEDDETVNMFLGRSRFFGKG
jgi:hypothetical protein